ncbi:glycerophosphodiester phosphodiesterase family protein [Paenibacillus sp.]|uniref:glycerophosphodiester phosphodiesterase family protein n=1 Tax=Paenibacillus sp. TaxID=58172 RepID=UPI0035655079
MHSLAFQKALEAGVGMLEFDLRLTKDNVVFVIHDETVDRTTNGSGPVGDYTWAELRQLDASGWFGKVFEGLKIPSFEELCDLIEPYPELLLNVEVKSSPHAKQVVDQAMGMLKERGYLPRCVFTCFDAAVIAYLHDTYNVKTQGFMADEMYNFDPGEQGTYSKMWAIAFPMRLLTAERVKAFQEKGLLPWCYCPDTEEQVAYALDCGVTLLTCNNPLPAIRRLQEIR